MRFDLHLHTTGSDGRLTPSQMVALAFERGLEVISITDHDSISGVGEAMAAAAEAGKMTVVPGVEINTDLATGELHVLGYFIKHEDAELAASLAKIRESRVGRAQKMLAKLNEMGMPVDWQRVLDLARGESICRPHIAQAMLEKGYISIEKEAFDKYIGRNCPAYVGREKVGPVEAVRIIKKAGGIPVLAHPADIADVDNLIVELKTAGLDGIEAYYDQYDSRTVSRIVGLAKRHDLLTTGGSDYHHFCDGRETQLGSVDIPESSIVKLFAAAGRVYRPA
ncbi:MAG: PHP domain-containing protein [Dehalococcoidia bacterium]|nr:PHP domain-containing protein [Dehalococcoidia bacterium]